MFSPEASVNATTSLRNSRRRRRNDSDGPKQLQPRKRSKLGHESLTPATHEIPVRTKRESSYSHRAAAREDGSCLTKTARYNVHQLTTPVRIRASTFGPYKAQLRCPSTSDYAIAVTRKQVFIWDYINSSTGTPNRLLDLPHPIKDTDAVPLGYLVTSSASSDIGLILVQSTAAKISYWENIDALEPGTLLQNQQNVAEASISGMLRGDSVERIQEASHAGYVLLFKSGCLAHLTIRDAQGRPKVQVNWLENAASRGWLSGLAHTLGAGFKRTLSAVKMRTSTTKGNVEVIAPNGEGVFKAWEVSWTNNNNFIREYNATEEIKNALASAEVFDSAAKEEVKLVDFELLGNTSEVVTARNADGLEVLILVAIETPAIRKYALVELTMTPQIVQPRRVIPISVHEGLSANASPEIAKLLVPEPQHTAFIAFDHAVVVVTLANPVQQESPEDQLFAEAGTSVSAFQDVIHLRQGQGVNIVQCSNEPQSSLKDEPSSIVLCTQREGLLRVSATAPWKMSRKSERKNTMAMSKISQAVMYGSATSLLDLENNAGLDFTEAEVEEAAIHISRSIMRTDIDGLPLFTASVDDHLGLRLKSLQRLADHLRTHYPPLSRRTRWILLTDAEQVAAARETWRAYERHSAQHDTKQGSVLPFLVEAIGTSYKTTPTDELGNLDRVRQFFIRDVRSFDRILKSINLVIATFHEKKLIPHTDIITYVIEASDLACTLLTAAWKFREANLKSYGLENEKLENGILVTGYQGLPEFWTARADSMNAMRDCVRQFQDIVERTANLNIPVEKTPVAIIAKQQPGLVLTTCVMHIERYRWLCEQNDADSQRSGKDVKALFEKQIRTELISSLSDIGMAQQGMAIAEQLHDVKTLVELLIDQQMYMEETHVDAAERKEALRQLAALEKQTEGYFARLGDDFANAYYAAQIKNHRLGFLLNSKFGKSEQLTNFLQSRGSHDKLSWINDAVNGGQVNAASYTLMKLATDHEQSSWAKKMQLSISRLGLLSMEHDIDRKDQKQKSLVSAKVTRDLLAQNRTETVVNDIQERLFRHIRPSIMSALDEESILDNVCATYSDTRTKKRTSLNQLAREGLRHVIEHKNISPDLLIEVLTLIDPVADGEIDSTDSVAGKEFLLALKVLQESYGAELNKPGTLGDMMCKIIWKRLLSRQDWAAIDKAAGKSDAQQEAVLEKTLLFETIKNGILTQLNMPIPTATQTLGSGSRETDLAAIRFPNPDIARGIASDNAADDIPLEQAIKKHDVERWLEAIKELARKKAKAEVREGRKIEEGFVRFLGDYRDPEIEERVDLRDWVVEVDEEVVAGLSGGGYDGSEEEEEFDEGEDEGEEGDYYGEGERGQDEDEDADVEMEME